MINKLADRIREDLAIIWTIAAKDIVDALRNRLVISLIIMLSLALLMPKLLPLFFEQPQMVLPVYNKGEARLLAKLKNAPDISVQKLASEQELKLALCGAIYPEIGLMLPPNFDTVTPAGEAIKLQGYACWSKRFQVSEVQPKLEGILTQALGQPVIIQTDGNLLYPPSDGVLLLSLATINWVLMVLMMGVFLVPHLLFEEKQTKTMQALLVSPASISQVIAGKALAGSFYILVTAVVIFSIFWADVVHWDAAILFVIGGAIFSIAMGLVLGSFYEKQQDMVGWMTALILLLTGSVLVSMLGMELPDLVKRILPWVPSVALAEVCRAAFSETVSTVRVWTKLGTVLAVSLPLYALVIWKVRRSDR
jgi:ABC-2 type transport system permease protein